MVMAVALLTESVDWNPSPIGLYRRNTSRSPHGERGLKCRLIILRLYCHLSLSSRRAWIEMLNLFESITDIIASLSSRRAWIEICVFSIAAKNKIMSLSSRRAWIEITSAYLFCKNNKSRSPHGERGLKFCVSRCYPHDTLGRSPHGERGMKLLSNRKTITKLLSLSSRRAWIEMWKVCAYG